MKKIGKYLKDILIMILLSFGKNRKVGCIPILLYHSINNNDKPPVYSVRLTNFEQQLKYLKKKKYVSINVNQLHDFLYNKVDLPKKSFMITFDDGFNDNFEAIIMAKKYGFNSVLFLATSFVGRRYNFIPFQGNLSSNGTKMSTKSTKIAFLSIDELINLRDIGTDICPHTHTHIDLTESVKDKQREDILMSVKWIKDNLKIDSTCFCYPYGKYNENSIEVLKELNIELGFAVSDGMNTKFTSPYKIQRRNVWDTNKKIHIKLLLSTKYSAYKRISTWILKKNKINDGKNA